MTTLVLCIPTFCFMPLVRTTELEEERDGGRLFQTSTGNVPFTQAYLSLLVPRSRVAVPTSIISGRDI